VNLYRQHPEQSGCTPNLFFKGIEKDSKGITMKLIIIILSVIIFVGCTALAGPPEWFISSKYDWVDPSTHIIGVGSGMSYDVASERAGADIAGQIESHIEAQSEVIISSYIEDDREYIRETFRSSTKSFTSMVIKGAQIMEKAQDGDKFYILMAVLKNNFLSELASELDQKQAVIKKIRKDADDLISDGKIFPALEMFMETDELVAGLITRASLYTAIAGKPYINSQALSGPAILSEVRKVLGKIKIEKVSGDKQSGKSGRLLSEPLVVRVYYKKDDVSMPDVRLKLKDNDGKTTDRQYTGDKGQAGFWAYALGNEKGRMTISIDLRKIPEVFRRDIKEVSTTFKYEISETVPVAFTVKIVDENDRRIDKVERIISQSVIKAGHHISDVAPFWLTGKMEPVEAHKIDGFDGAMYQVKTELELFMKAKATGETVDSITLKADGLDKKSEKTAVKKSHDKLKVKKKDMAKMLANAGDELRKVNEKISADAYNQGKACYDQGKFNEALGYLTKVTMGAKLNSASKLIQHIKDKFTEEALKRLQEDKKKQEAELQILKQ